jgi:hypothetical protein
MNTITTHTTEPMSDQGAILIKYSIDQIFDCREANCLMIRDLEQYCSNKKKNHKTILTELMKPMDDITKSHSHGINPNDISLKNMIRESLNKINPNNYKNVLDDLKSINYTCENHFALLADELIIKSMNDVLACKGIDMQTSNQKTPSEIYMSIAVEFSNFFIEHNKQPIKFRSVLTRECSVYFDKLIDIKERMDQNNPHRVSNYKGFMNMLGLMYAYNLFPCEIVKQCLFSVTQLILDSNLPHDDCDNYYSGLARLMNRILCHFEKEVVQNNKIDDFFAIKNIINDINDRITLACDGDNYQSKSSATKPLRMFSIMTHGQNVSRFKKLCDMYQNLTENSQRM